MYINLSLIVGDLMGGGYETFCYKYKHNILFSLVWGLFLITIWDSLCDCHIQSLAFSFPSFYPSFYVFLSDCNSGFYHFGKVCIVFTRKTAIITNLYLSKYRIISNILFKQLLCTCMLCICTWFTMIHMEFSSLLWP